MPKCSFCKKQYDIPNGTTIIMNDGRALYFCSSKCRKNHNLGRDSRKVKWIKKEKKSKILKKKAE